MYHEFPHCRHLSLSSPKRWFAGSRRRPPAATKAGSSPHGPTIALVGSKQFWIVQKILTYNNWIVDFLVWILFISEIRTTASPRGHRKELCWTEVRGGNFSWASQTINFLNIVWEGHLGKNSLFKYFLRQVEPSGCRIAGVLGGVQQVRNIFCSCCCCCCCCSLLFLF